MSTAAKRYEYLKFQRKFNESICDSINVIMCNSGNMARINYDDAISYIDHSNNIYTVDYIVKFDRASNKAIADIVTTGNNGVDIILRIDLADVQVKLYHELMGYLVNFSLIVTKTEPSEHDTNRELRLHHYNNLLNMFMISHDGISISDSLVAAVTIGDIVWTMSDKQITTEDTNEHILVLYNSELSPLIYSTSQTNNY